jgi:hypothetical protein
MGKSTLLARVTAELADGDAVLLRALRDDAECALPLGVVSQLVAGISALPAALAGLAQGLAELNPPGPGAGCWSS